MSASVGSERILAGLRLHVTCQGQGPDVFFVHGWASTGHMWDHLVSPLSARFRCWTLDLPGCGESEKPPREWYAVERYSDLVAELVRQAGDGPARIVGHSMGGLITLDLAARHPECVARLAVFNPVVTGRGVSLRPFARRMGFSRAVLQAGLRLAPAGARLLSLAAREGHGPWLLRASRRRLEDFSHCTADSLVHSGRAAVAYDVSPRLGEVRAPALLVVGRFDLMACPSEGRLAARRIPGARLVLLPAGHFPTDEWPGRALQLLEAFLT